MKDGVQNILLTYMKSLEKPPRISLKVSGGFSEMKIATADLLEWEMYYLSKAVLFLLQDEGELEQK